MQRNSTGDSAVFLTRLRLQNFRNFVDEAVTLPHAGAAVTGANAQGKTNLLEAIYYLTTFRSFRGGRDEQLVRMGADVFRVEGRAADAAGSEWTVAAAFQRGVVNGGTKRVTVNGSPVARQAEAVGRLPAVIFSSTDVEMMRGGPALRRRFLDVAISLARPGYLAALQRFRRALDQRNECLRRGERAGEVQAWDEAVASAGGSVAAERALWVVRTGETFAEHYGAISGGARARLTYASSLRTDEPGDAAAWSRAYAQALERTAGRDRARRYTSTGPHLDDLAIGMERSAGDAIDLRTYGSGGEQRTAAIALRLTEAAWLRDATGREPIALVDDVFGELDPERVRGILELLGARGGGQVILTAPGPVDVSAVGRDLVPLVVEGGRIRSALGAAR
jgi:DNA replication and repair protein RecF